MLDADGVVEKSKLDEFRANNIALCKSSRAEKRFEGIDPDEVRQLAEEKRKLEEAQQLKAGEVDKVVEARLKTAKAEWDKQLAAVTSRTRRADMVALTAIQIDQGVVTEATKRGLRPTAIPDITARARTAVQAGEWRAAGFRGGRPDCARGQGWRHADDFGRVGGCAGVRRSASCLNQTLVAVPPATAPVGCCGNRSVKNPFRKETWNLTEQMKLQKSDPQLAARLQEPPA